MHLPAHGQGVLFDRLSIIQYFLTPSKKHISRCQIVKQDLVLPGSMPTLDLALGLRVIGPAPGMRHALFFQYNTDLLFSRIMATGGSTDISNRFFCTSFVCHHRFLFRLTMS